MDKKTENEDYQAESPESGQSLRDELENLRRELETKEREAKDNYERFLRQTAELENFKKRTAREKSDTIRYANESFVRDLLPVVDNLERALEHARGGGNGKPLLDGIEMVLKSFQDVLSRHGVTTISAKGRAFDPEKHEAIAQIETDQVDPNTVVEEHHKGYYLQDRLLRPALVSVAKRPDDKSKPVEGNGEVENEGGDD
jgi:molecular chaperone GrpE